MNDDALKKLWQSGPVETPRVSDDQQLAAVKGRMKKFDPTIFWRDIRENIAAAVVAVWFGIYFFKFSVPLARVASALIVASCFFIAGYSMWKKRRAGKTSPDAPVMESLQIELRKVDAQIGLLRSVLWWYLLPIFVGVLLFYFALQPSWSSRLGYTVVVIAVDVFIYWLNQRAVRRVLMPLKQELEAAIHCSDVVPPPVLEKKKCLMTKLFILIAAALLCLGLVKLLATPPDPKLASKEPAAIDELLKKTCAKYKMPAAAVAIVMDGKIVATNAVGVRKSGSNEKVTVNDKFHIGSVTKSMTATIAAMLVEQGKISWTTTIGEAFPDWKDRINPQYLDVTLEQLLSHRGGVPGEPPNDLWRKAWDATGSPSQQRLEFVKGILSREPEAKPGTKHIYSNQGYAIAGVMLEKATGKPWEELMQSMLFQPLGMTSAGFGAPATVGKVDQPWGHRSILSFVRPVPPGPGADNPAAIGPAGTVHCSVEDLAKYAIFHMAGQRGEGKLLKTATFKKVHKPITDDYALGWMSLKRSWAHGRALMHNGSNTMFYVVVWIAPKRNFAVVVATNSGAEDTFTACDNIASEVITQFLAE